MLHKNKFTWTYKLIILQYNQFIMDFIYVSWVKGIADSTAIDLAIPYETAYFKTIL